MIKNLKLFYKFVFTFSIILLIVVSMGIFTINRTVELNDTINDFKDHPFTVTNAVKDVKINMLSIHNELSYAFIDLSDENLIKTQIDINTYEQETLDLLRLIEIRFLGDVEKVILFRETFIQSIDIHHNILNLLIEKKMDDAKEAKIVADDIAEATIADLTEELLLVADYKAKEFQDSAFKNYTIIRRQLIYSISATLLILMLFAYFLTRSITRPMSKLKKSIEIMVEGGELKNIDIERLDEIGQITRSVVWLFTELKIQQKKEAESMRKNFQILFNNMPLGAALFKKDNLEKEETVIDIIEVNARYSQIFDRSNMTEKHNGKINVKEAITFPTILSEYLNRVKPDGATEVISIQVGLENIKAEIVVFQIRENEFLLLIDDITEKIKRELNEQKKEAINRNQQKLESIGMLASGVAHEINNPINGIINYGQLIIDSDGKDEDIVDYATEIMSEGNRIAQIVRSLLRFSRYDTEKATPVEIKAVLDGVVSLAKMIIKEDQITLDVNIDGNLPLVKCNTQQIQQVIMNLITNAKSALNEKYFEFHENKRIHINVEKIEDENTTWVRISVLDHGCGIPDSIKEKIYDPFFTTKGRVEGTGLGLSISYGIIEEHNGRIHFDSVEGEYTKFNIDLPIKKEL